jgi:hypothetical protein
MGKGKATAAAAAGGGDNEKETASGGTAVVEAEGATEVDRKFTEVNQKLDGLAGKTEVNQQFAEMNQNFGKLEKTLDAIAKGQGGRTGECHRLAGEMQAKLNFGRIDNVLAGGLHAFLTGLIEHTAQLGAEIEAFYTRA